ncbi:response regulator transcription factor [Pararhizobium haloflavum]|uniref:response regulator transcription factor n=1 Tax=Pararhizobium haloflavum TaxID=2037914 RepID=UPI001FE11C93|nr:response regulator transcription factor [Pararhizobium haloflavum]
MDTAARYGNGTSAASEKGGIDLARYGLGGAGDVGECEQCLLVIDNRALGRECLSKALIDHNLGMEVAAMGSVEEWRKDRAYHTPLAAILLNLGGRRMSDAGVANEVTRLAAEFKAIPVIILADTDDLKQILKALECGARGYIPTSVDIDVCVEAIGLAIAGGIFVPASSVLAMRHMIETTTQEARPLTGMFTTRQAEVVEALRRGKANKIIAYELKLRESTVKVHIRNIMKKLKATNRTEVAYKINDMFPMESALGMPQAASN